MGCELNARGQRKVKGQEGYEGGIGVVDKARHDENIKMIDTQEQDAMTPTSRPQIFQVFQVKKKARTPRLVLLRQWSLFGCRHLFSNVSP